MKTECPSLADMQHRIARFKNLKPRAAHWNDNLGIPAEALRLFNPKANYVLMAPASLPGRLSPNPAIVDGDKGVIRVGLAVAAPNDGPELHVHWKTHETFMALSGRWLIRWGDEGQESVELEPYDMIAMPPRVARQFINISDQDAHLLVIIQGQPEDFDDVGRLPSIRQKIIDKYGEQVLANMEANGWDFSLVPRSMRNAESLENQA
ncbi:cupin domain-containing protein [Pigmentiphaga sp.]|uniref:cupin domain-containing protein n=1 Tax=Pigmentiphaga sp. TaxID=1977564 RepID=UPI0025DF84FB|nr:cupin domain-containing protein [Pigmentiphaga sp.]MBX6319203.1 cupin domain-containing protein [Pigmentiphaga sp.]